MNTYIIDIKFLWDEGVDHRLFQFTAANDEDARRIVDQIKKAHDFLQNDDPEDRYGTDGRNPDILIAYVNKTFGRACKELKPDFTLTFS